MLAVGHITGRLTCLADSLALCYKSYVTFASWHITGRLTCPMPLLSIKLWVPQRGTGGSYVDKPAETLRLASLASYLVRAPNSRSGGHEFKSPVRQELGALTKSGKTLGVRCFYKLNKEDKRGRKLYTLMHTFLICSLLYSCSNSRFYCSARQALPFPQLVEKRSRP